MEAQRQEQCIGGNLPRVIGLDMHPDIFTAAALVGRDARNAQIQWIHDGLPQKQLEKWLQRHVDPMDLIVIEASGNTFATVDRIQAAGRQAIVLETVRSSQIRKAYCTTDKVSAVKLARVYLSGMAIEVWKPDEKTRERREVFYAYVAAVRDVGRGKNRIRSWLLGHGIRKRKGLALCKQSGLDWALQACEWSPAQKLLTQQMFHDLWQAEARRKALRRIMAREVASDPKLLALLRLCGVREIAAYALGAVIGDINRFRNPKKLVAYLGLSPGTKWSGNARYGGPLAQNGCAEMRRILVQAAHAVLRYGQSPTHRWGLRIVMRKGRNHAAIAVVRKVAVAVWYVLKGHFTPMKALTPALMRKLVEFSVAVGAKQVREMGYKTSKEFQREKLKLLLQTS